MHVPRIPCLVAAFSVALSILTAFPMSGSAASTETKTLSYEETAALFGYTEFRKLSNTSTVGIMQAVYSDTGSSPSDYVHCPSGWWNNYVINNIPYIGIRYYGTRQDFLDAGSNGQMQVLVRGKFALSDLYSFTCGFGYLGDSVQATYGRSTVSLKYYKEGVLQSALTSTSFTVYTAVNNDATENGTPWGCVCSPLTPPGANAPVYSIFDEFSTTSLFMSVYGMKNSATSESIDGISFTGYSYLFIRCPTIKTDVDVMADINTKLDSVTGSLDEIYGSLQGKPEQGTAISDRQDAIVSGSSLISDYDAAESSLMTEISLYNPNDFYTYHGDSVTWFGHFWRFIEGMPFLMTFSTVGIMFAILSYVLYGRK